MVAFMLRCKSCGEEMTAGQAGSHVCLSPIGKLAGLHRLAREGNQHAVWLLAELLRARDDNERKAVIDRWTAAVRPVVHLAVDLAQSLGLAAAAANASTSASPSSFGGGDGAVGETVSTVGTGGSPTAPSERP